MHSVLGYAGACFSLRVSATTRRSLFNLLPLSTTDYVLFSSILFIIKLKFSPVFFLSSFLFFHFSTCVFFILSHPCSSVLFLGFFFVVSSSTLKNAFLCNVEACFCLATFHFIFIVVVLFFFLSCFPFSVWFLFFFFGKKIRRASTKKMDQLQESLL